MSFADLGLSPEVLQAVRDAGYETPTPIQVQAIPYVLMGRDVLGCAQTGTGKTAGFTLPMLDILAAGRARARPAVSLSIIGSAKLAVLPVPVCAQPSTSRLAMTWGIDCCWIGVGEI